MNLTIPLSAQLLADVMITAFEGGSNYWVFSAETLTLSRTNPWYADPEFWTNPFEVKLRTEDGDVVFTHTLLQDALTKLPPHVAGNIGAENFDADDADVLLQTACFGEVIYG